MTSFLVTGAGGQLGRAVMRRLGAMGLGCDRNQLDITNEADVKAALRRHQPSVVINCAAFTNVDLAEGRPDAAFAANADGPGVLAEMCASQGIRLVHISTDYVFNGEAGPYREDDPEPLNIYGASKLAGERAVLESHCHAVVLRVSWLFDGGANRFVSAVLRRAREVGRLTMVADQISCPTPALAAADAIVTIGRRLLEGGPSGLYHFCGRPAAARLEWARAILNAAGVHAIELDATSVDRFPSPARRPKHSVLDCTRIRRDFAIEQPDWCKVLTADLAGACSS